MVDKLCLKMPDFHVTFRDLLHAVNLRHGTDGFTSPPKEGVLRIFFVLKNPTVSEGFEPSKLGYQRPAHYLRTTEAALGTDLITLYWYICLRKRSAINVGEKLSLIVANNKGCGKLRVYSRNCFLVFEFVKCAVVPLKSEKFNILKTVMLGKNVFLT